MSAPLDYLRTTSTSSGSSGNGALDYLRKKKKEDEGVNVQNEIANSKSRLASVGVRNVDTTTKNNVLMDVLTLLSKFNYAGDNAMKEFIDRGDPGSATPGQFDPLQAWKRGWSLEETPTLTDSFARMGLSDKEWFNIKGPLGIEIKPSVAGIAGLATSFLNPLNPLNFAGLGLTAKGAATGAKGLASLEKAFGPEVAAKMAASLGDDVIEGIGARTVGDVAGQLGKRGNFADLIKEGLAATGANASTRLPYNGTRKLTAEFALPSIPFVTPYKKLGEVAIPGTQHIVNAAGAVGRGVKSTGIGDWFGKNFSTKFVSNKVPGEVALRKMNVASKIDEYITSLETSGEHPTTLSMLRELKDELDNIKLANGEVNVPTWQTDPKEWFNAGNPINDIFTKYGVTGKEFDVDMPVDLDLPEQGGNTVNKMLKGKEVAPTFYSKLQQTVEKKMQNKMTTQDFQNWVSKQGIKAEELKWADIQGIAGTDGVVTKQEVLDWVNSHDIQIEDVVKGNKAIPDFDSTFADTEWYKAMGRNNPTLLEKMKARYTQSDLEGLEGLVDSVSVNIGDDLYEAFDADIARTLNPLEGGNTKFGGYTVPGGKDYQEMLLKWGNPRKPGGEIPKIENTPMQWEEPTRGNFFSEDYHISPTDDFTYRATELLGNGKDLGVFKTADEAKEAVEKYHVKKTGTPNLYRSSHWDESNVLAHVRFDTRTVDGKKVLFIQELQSDWHQTGRKQGYTKEITEYPKEIQPLLHEYKQLQIDTDKAIDLAADGSGDMDPVEMLDFINDKSNAYSKEMARIEKRQDEIREIVGSDILKEIFWPTEAVKQAPFSKNWDELAMKRMLRYAAENGYDKVAWATGSQNASRYGLEKQVDKLTYQGGQLYGYKEGLRTFTKKVAPKDLPGMVGENVAKQLLNEEKPIFKIVEPKKVKIPDRIKNSPKAIESWLGTLDREPYKLVDQWDNVWFSSREKGPVIQRLTSTQDAANRGQRYVTADLSVGGQGMKGFYDEMLPSKMDKYLKQWGQKTGEMDLNKQTITSAPLDVDAFNQHVMDNIGDWDDWDDDVDLGRRIAEELKAQDVHSLTDEELTSVVDNAIDAAGFDEDARGGITMMIQRQLSMGQAVEKDFNKFTGLMSDSYDEADGLVGAFERANEEMNYSSFTSQEVDRLITSIKNATDRGIEPTQLEDLRQYIEDVGMIKEVAPTGQSMQKAFDITPEMRDSVMYQGQPLFKQNMVPPTNTGTFVENILGVVREGKTIPKETLQAMAKNLGVEPSVLKKMVNEIATTLKRQDKQIKTANTVDFSKWIGNYLKDPALRDDFLNNSDEYAQKSWQEIMKDLKDLDPDITDAQAFKNAMYMRSLSDAIYDKVPDELKPYFTGLIKPDQSVGGRAGKEAVDTTGIKDLNKFNSGIVINYKGVNVFYPFNKGAGFNNLDMADFDKIFKAIDSYKLKAETMTRSQISVDPVDMRPGYGGRTNSTTEIWVNPITVKEKSQDWLNDVIGHEIGHGIEYNSNGIVSPTQYDSARNQDAILSLSKFDDATDPDDIYQALLNMSTTRASDKDLQYFADAIYDLKNKNKGYISDYAKESADKSAALGFRESIAEDYSYYNTNPELFRELFPARTKVLDQMIEESTRVLMPYNDYIKAVTGEIDKVTENYGKHMAEINNRIDEIINKEGFEFVEGATAAGQMRKDLSSAFHNAQIKSQDFIQQVETIFKDMNLKQRKEIMAAAAEGTELDDPRMMEVLNHFIKWRESVVKSYNDLGVPIRALDKYVPFIPVRALQKNESKLLNEVYGTGAELDADQLVSYLFDVDPNLQHRTTRAANPAEVNALLGKEWLTEDAALAMAVRGTRAIKAQESIGFMNGFIEKYGLPVGQLKGKMPEGYQFYTQTIESSGKPTITVAKDPGAEGVFAIPTEFAETINNYMGMIHDPRASNEFLRLFDKATGFYKKAAYLWNPGHLGRDALGNIFNGWLMGNQDARTYMNSARAMFNFLHGDQKMMLKVGKQKMTSKELWETAREYGLVDIGMVMAETPHEMVQGLKGGKNLHFYTNLMGDLSRTNDTWTRLANFMYNLNQGMPIEQAAVSVKKYLFDYFDLTPLERKVMTRIVPFYTFMRKNLPVQVETLIRNPRPFSQVNTTANYVTGEYNDPSERPQSLKDTVAMKMGEAWVAPNLPMNDLSKIPTNKASVSNLLASINPIIRTPVEMAMNKQIFSNRDISKYEGEMQNLPMSAAISNLTGGKVELPQVERNGIGYALEQAIPTLRNLDIVTDPENSRQQARQVSMAGGPALYADEQVQNNRLYEQRDALRAAISKISDSGVEVPTTTDIENSEKVNMRPKEWLLFKKQMMAQGLPEPSITDFENSAKIGIEIEPYLKIRAVAVELDISGPTATDYEYANKVGMAMKDYLQLKAEAKKRDVAAPTAADFGRASELGVSIVDFLDVKARAKAAGIAIDKYINNGGR